MFPLYVLNYVLWSCTTYEHLSPETSVYNPNRHIKEFHVVCSSMKPIEISEKQVKLRAFPFSLANSAKEWLYYWPSSITIWNEMKKLFLEKYFPASKAANTRKEIYAFDKWMERVYMSIGSTSRNFVLHALIIRLASNSLFNTFIRNSCQWSRLW